MDQIMTRRLYLVVGVFTAALASILYAAALPDAILAGDADPYRQRMVELFSGKLPYIEFPFEHLPLMIVPMGLAWILGGHIDLRSYVLALAGVSTACLLITGLLLRRLETEVGFPRLAIRWLVLVVPLMPFLLFRNDSFVVMLAIGGVLLLVLGREAVGLGAIIAAVSAKLWPAAWAAIEWWRRRRLRAVIIAATAVVALAITISPGVQSIQDPRGLHTETLAGSGIGLWRSLVGTELGLSGTAAVYIDAPGWVLLIDVAIGVALAWVVLRRMATKFTWPLAWRLFGALTGVIMIASPFLSTQYVAWLAPFAATDMRTFRPMLAINAASLVLITTWFDLFDGARWWWAALFVRNLLLVYVVASLAGMSASRAGLVGRSKTEAVPSSTIP